MTNPHCPIDTAEVLAFKLVPKHTGGVLEPFDHSGRQGAVDALLHFPDGRTAALEVTSVAASGLRQLDAIRRRTDLRPVNPGQWTWIATVRTPQDFAELKEHAGRIIVRCEALGVASANDARHLAGDSDFDWLFSSSATLQGFPNAPKRGGADQPLPVLEGMVGGGRSESPRDFENAVEGLIREDHVVKRVQKLSESGYTEQHLFMMVDNSALPESAHHALRQHRTPPSARVELPGRVTHLWLLIAFSHRLLVATADGWEWFDTATPADEV